MSYCKHLFLQMRKEGNDPVKPGALSHCRGKKIKLLWQRVSRLPLSVAQITSWTETAAQDSMVGLLSLDCKDKCGLMECTYSHKRIDLCLEKKKNQVL